MKRFLLMAVAVSVPAIVGLAQGGAVGTWTGETQGRGGPQMVTVTLAAGEGGMTGTWTQGEQETPLTEVAVNGNEVTFQRALAGRGGGAGITLTYTGEISGDQMTLNAAAAGGGAPGGGAPGGGGGGRGAQGPLVLTRQ